MHNSTLSLLATERPITREEFLKIRGLGLRKYEQYGEAFINAIKEHLGNH
jgi:ATP-dependent DNA helicase RecQ